MRASILFCAPLLARLGRAPRTSCPAGAVSAPGPSTYIWQGLAKMGAVERGSGRGAVALMAAPGLHGAELPPCPFPQRRGDGDVSAGRCLRQRQDHPAGSGAGPERSLTLPLF